MADRTLEPANDDAGTENAPPPSRAWKRVAGAGVAVALALFVVLALASCVLWLPRQLYPSLTATDLRDVSDPAKVQDLKAERLKLQNDARTTLLQGLGALLVLTGAGIGASVTLRQVRATRAQITETATASRNQLKLSEQGQVTDRFTKAIDQLDQKNALVVRLGGLYALERIARDSPDDRATIAEVLCAYVRTAPRPDPPSRTATAAEPPKTDASSTETSSAAKLSSLSVRAPDVQAALTILGRWQDRLGDPPRELDLHDAEIRGARLDNAQLGYANLRDAQLQDANLYHADLRLTILAGAQLQGADLRGAQLQGAKLGGAQLPGVELISAQLQDADLSWALLQDANLMSAQLQRATLINTYLQGAYLLQAQLEGANLTSAELEGATLISAQLQGANLTNAKLRGARLDFAQLQSARLGAAQLSGATLRNAQLQSARLGSAQLSGAVLAEANLQDAYLMWAWLQDADLSGAQLQGAILYGVLASEGTHWPDDSWDEARIAAAGVRFEAEREADVGSAGDAAQPDEEQDSSGR